ncbi:MAG: ABC transporter ATP-binding protein [Chloroflexi bacterium]|nr:MAG: ABC transporter ATP-binding protein [Chloroflexota bacterium]
MSTWGRPSVLQVTDLRAGYGSTPVLTGVNLKVGEGEVVALMGRNGMGKTTLLRTVMGLLPARGGSIRWKGGQEISKLPTHLRARLGLGYVPQGRDIFPGLTVRENLRLGGMAAGHDGTRQLEDVLALFPMLPEKLSARGASLSGGQQQLLALARALVAGPKVLLLDEPSEGIQPSILEQIVERIRTINRQEGIAVLLVEQNIQFAAALADRAYIMNKGVVVRELPMARIVDDPEIQREYMGV